MAGKIFFHSEFETEIFGLLERFFQMNSWLYCNRMSNYYNNMIMINNELPIFGICLIIVQSPQVRITVSGSVMFVHFTNENFVWFISR